MKLKNRTFVLSVGLVLFALLAFSLPLQRTLAQDRELEQTIEKTRQAAALAQGQDVRQELRDAIRSMREASRLLRGRDKNGAREKMVAARGLLQHINDHPRTEGRQLRAIIGETLNSLDEAINAIQSQPPKTVEPEDCKTHPCQRFPLDPNIASAMAGFFARASINLTLDPNTFSRERSSVLSEPVSLTANTDLRFEIEWTERDLAAGRVRPTVQIGLRDIGGFNARETEKAELISLTKSDDVMRFMRGKRASICGNMLITFQAPVTMPSRERTVKRIGLYLEPKGFAMMTSALRDGSCPFLPFDCKRQNCDLKVTLGFPPFTYQVTYKGKCTPVPALSVPPFVICMCSPL